MKTKVLSSVALFLMGTASVFAGNKTEKIEVKGNCGMCETRIEKTVKAVEGVSNADWDKISKKLKVTFDDTKTDIDKIEMAIAKVGHDTPHHKAEAEVYNKLPECCKYERNPAESEQKTGHEGHQH
jgi:copper chaperone CopZ